MHLHLPFAAPWIVKTAPADQFAAILPGPPTAPAGRPDAVVTFGPIRIKPDEPRLWQDQVARGDLPRDGRPRMGRTIDLQTHAGWPLRLIEVEIIDPRDAVIEARLCAFYLFMEHAASAIVRAESSAALERHGTAILEILQHGRPDWRGLPACVADLWDLEASAPPQPRLASAGRPLQSVEGLQHALDAAELARAATTTPLDAGDHLRRGGMLRELGRHAEALAAFDAAVALDDQLELAHYFRGAALLDLGRRDEAIAAWRRATELVPDRPDTHYNLAQTLFLGGDFAAALAEFQRTAELDPGDFLIGRKLVQCLHALERYDDAAQARVAFRERWSTTTDPRARFITEYVFDQFEADGFSVYAIETLKPSKPSMYTMLAFRAVHRHGNHEHPLPAAVLVETSDQARAAGTPFVLGVQAGTQFRVVGTSASLPPYPELKAEVTKLLRDALAAAKPPA